eukprot:5731315-Pleurochrysis_carterae.AAC.2
MCRPHEALGTKSLWERIQLPGLQRSRIKDQVAATRLPLRGPVKQRARVSLPGRPPAQHAQSAPPVVGGEVAADEVALAAEAESAVHDPA